MNNFIEVKDMEFNVTKRINVRHIVSYGLQASGQILVLLSTGKNISVAETPSEIDRLIKKAEELPFVAETIGIPGPSNEVFLNGISESVKMMNADLKRLIEKQPRKKTVVPAEKL
jgi:hypothetical protein